MLKIEDGIPIEKGLRALPADDEIWRTLEQLQIGQSFLIPKDFLIKTSAKYKEAKPEDAYRIIAKTSANRIATTARQTGKKFARRFMSTGIRIWRKE